MPTRRTALAALGLGGAVLASAPRAEAMPTPAERLPDLRDLLAMGREGAAAAGGGNEP